MDIKHTLYQDVISNEDKNKTAIYFRGNKISYETLNKNIEKYAKRFIKLNIKKDTVVAVLSLNIPETIYAFYALNKIGAICLMLHPQTPIKNLEEAIKETKAEYLIITDILYSQYHELLKDSSVKTYYVSFINELNFIEKIFFKKSYSSALSFIDETKYIDSILEDDIEVETNRDDLKPSVYLLSGGTTNKSKTIILNDRALRFPGSQASEILGRDFGELSMLGLLPFFHGFGLAMGMHAPLMSHGSIYLMIKFDIKEIVAGINSNHLNIIIAVPYMIEKLLSNKAFTTSKLKNIYMTFVGADTLSPTLNQRYNDLMEEHGSINRIYEGYGLTETVTVCAVNTFNEHKDGTVGKVLKGNLIKIVDFDDKNKELPNGSDGEILISSIANCLGYLNTEKKNQPFFVDKNKVTYIATGDIGHLDDEGFIHFKNRMKDVIKIAGYNVYPKDIEAMVSKIDGVFDACCIFVDVEHPYIHLYVENHDIDDKTLASTIKKYLEERLLKYQVPEKITILPNFPRTSVGKIDKKTLVHF